MTSSGTANGTAVQLYDCNNSVAQVWVPQADGTLKSPNSGRCLDVGTAAGTIANTTPIDIEDCTASITQQWAAQLSDADGTLGATRETQTLDGPGGALLSSAIHTAASTLTATRTTPVTGGQDWTAHMVTNPDAQTRTWIAASSTWRWTDTQTTFNSYGLPTQVTDYGDTTTSADDRCTTTTYVTPDTTNWLVDYPAQTLTTDCATSPGDADYLAGTQTLYDGSTTVGATPTQGLPTKTTALAAVSSGTLTWKQAGRSGYDTNGRITSSYDALDRQTSTAYTPASGGPVTQTTVTNPMNWTTTTTIQPVHDTPTSIIDANNKTTAARYDPLGRLTTVWLNNRPTSATPDLRYTYNLSASTPNWTETQKLGPTGNQIAGFQIYDGQQRLRQTQTPAPVANGGRNITDTAYDSRGLAAKTSTFWNSTATPSSTLASFSDTTVPTQHRYTYDNLERQTGDAFYSNGAQEWQTTASYDGDRTGVIPPTGGTTTQHLFDAHGNTVQMRQYTGATLSGSYQATTYTYDRLDRQTSTTDPAGNQWRTQYDLRGRAILSHDPDSGDITRTFDDAGQLLANTDARPVTLAYAYDNLGRITDEYLGSTTGTHLTTWAYDTLAKGQLTSTSAFRDTGTWTTTVTGYDDAYRPLGATTTVPAGAGSALTGDWTTNTSYNVDGSAASRTYPAAGGLGTETVTYGYDPNGYVLTAAGLDTYLSTATYQPWGDTYQITLGAASGGQRAQITTDQYPDTHRLKTIQVTTEHPGTPGTFDEQLTQQYTWNPAGELTSIDNQHAGATTDSQCFSYDFLQRLTTAFTNTPTLGGCTTTPSTSTVGGTDAYWQTYTYDTTGNRTQLT